MENMVDERFELCALIFRLVPGSYFDKETGTEYHVKLDDTFMQFAKHPVVECAKSLQQSVGLGFDAVGRYAVHLKKEDGKFKLIDDLQLLTIDSRWNEDRAMSFLKLLNDFYLDTQFGFFYNEHIKFYEEETRKFIDHTYGKIDFKWFAKYIDISHMRCIYSPSLKRMNFATRVGELIYSIVPHNSSIIHEYCHSFANPIAEKWYNENAAFKKMCDDTVAQGKVSWYQQGIICANEYVTRAFNILHDYQHGEGDLQTLILREQNHYVENSFPFMQQVYDMVVEY